MNDYFEADDPEWGPMMRNRESVGLEKYRTFKLADEAIRPQSTVRTPRGGDTEVTGVRRDPRAGVCTLSDPVGGAFRDQKLCPTRKRLICLSIGSLLLPFFVRADGLERRIYNPTERRSDEITEAWTAQWVWRPMAPGEDDVNMWMLARREFEVDGPAKTAVLRVSADTRYQLFINGQFVIDGPVKAYPEQYRYDRVEVARFLRPGPNAIAVRVHHWGRDTAQNIAVRPGLLVQLSWEDNRGAHTLGTDDTWRVIEDAAHDTRSPQVSAHLGFEEQYDARREHLGWMKAGYDASAWEAADAFSSVADGPWLNFRHSGIPPLAKTVHSAIAVLSIRSVRPPQVIATINVGRSQGIARKENNRNWHRFVLAGIVSSDRDQDAVVLRPSAGFIFGRIRMPGVDIDVLEDLLMPERVDIQLLKGDNPVILVLNDMSEVEEFQFALDADGAIELRAAFGKGPWSLAGPFTLDDADWPAISAAATVADLEPFRSRFRDLEANEIIGADVHALTSHRRELGPARVIEPEAMVIDNEFDAVIPAGEDDIELMIDLGKEYNAHVHFQIHAPAGVIVDANIFERFHDHAPQWSWRNRSSFRYVMGAKIEEPGGARITLTPRVDAIDRLVGVVPLHHGSVRLEWTRAADGSVDLRIEPSPGVGVALIPPTGWRIESNDTNRVELQPGKANSFRLLPAGLRGSR